MEIFQSIIQYILNLGSNVFVPLVILILGLVVGMKLKKAFLAALTLGIAFTVNWIYVRCSWACYGSFS